MNTSSRRFAEITTARPILFVRFFLITGLLLLAGCKTAPPKSSIGYNYTIQTGDTLDVVAGEYRKQGVDVTVDQIMAANPTLKATTNIQAGVQLFIPDNNRANLEDLKAKASHGDTVAECTIGVMYQQGHGVPQDYVQAAKWFQRAAKHGQGDAQFCLGELYQHGQGVKNDPAQHIGGVDETKHFSLRWCFCSNVLESHLPVLECAFNHGSRFSSQASPEAFVLGPFEAYEGKLLIEWPGDARFENNSARSCGGRQK